MLSRGGDHEIVKEVGVASSSLMCLGLPGLISSVLAVLGRYVQEVPFSISSCKSAWFIICKAKVHSQISYAYTHFYLKHYNDIVPGLCPLYDEDNLIGNAWEECKTARDKIEIKDASHLQKDGISYVCKLCKSELCCEANKHSLEKV